jgi:hypothetical protein|tara:strand:+ start:2958 stop:3191 length:234 start_codon:yes stop_codon:yes gene_type:complete
MNVTSEGFTPAKPITIAAMQTPYSVEGTQYFEKTLLGRNTLVLVLPPDELGSLHLVEVVKNYAGGNECIIKEIKVTI